MRALRIHAGPVARQHIEKNGLQPADICTLPGAAGGPKGLILGPLDRFIFGQWLPRSNQQVDLVGASIGAWRMATACLDEPVAAFERLEHDYIHQHFELQPGEKRPPAARVSELFGQNLQAFYGGRVEEVLDHPRYRLHIVTARGRHILGREHRWRTPLGYLGAFLTNTVHRKAMGAWLERVVFSTQHAALPFATSDYRTRQVSLSEANFKLALQASCSIPFVLQAVHNIPGAPPGAYWDGAITDYHLHLNYAASGSPKGLVFYPHFQQAVVPGWLDKGLKWRHKSTGYLDSMVLLAPDPDWVRTLPNGKLPDRNDFTHYGQDLAGRVKAWTGATSASAQLVDEFEAWLRQPDIGQVHAL
ncbi:phospholipase [Rhodoferax sp.]|uniref:phospholipase n=1 Tax=Rhodoferax sp. TaxID=50421 RepID=UPI002722DDA7|nr:phospholipase [Rhodoferax sp.]MDO9199225.1 phospholipase [Rhodoferax sp.]